MVMKSYDVATYGDLTYSDNNGTTTSNVVNKAAGLWYIQSQGGPPPYSAFKPHSYLKIKMDKLSGWEVYRQNPPNWLFHTRGGTSPDFSPWYLWQVFDPMATHRSAGITDAYNKAVANLNDQIRGNTDLSVDLAQASKTVRIGHDCAKVLTSLYKARNPLKIIEAVGEARLVWTYGLKPTLQSIYDAATFEARHYNNEFSFARGRGKSRSNDEQHDTGMQWPDNYYKSAWNGEVQNRCQVGVVMRIPDSPQTQIARLSSLNPVSIAWELVPFSFVADWFFNVGGYLRDLETAVTYSSYFVRGYRTDTSLTVYNISSSKNLSGSFAVELGEWGAQIRRMQLNRSILYGYPMPSRPIFNVNLGSGRLLNAAALLTLGLRTRGRSFSEAGGGSAFQRAQQGWSGVARGFSGYYRS